MANSQQLEAIISDCEAHGDQYYRLEWRLQEADQEAIEGGYTLFQVAISKEVDKPGLFRYMGQFGLIPPNMNSDLQTEYLDLNDFSLQSKAELEKMMLCQVIFQVTLDTELKR